MNLFDALINVIVKILTLVASAVIKATNAILVMIVAFIFAKILDLFVKRLYNQK